MAFENHVGFEWDPEAVRAVQAQHRARGLKADVEALLAKHGIQPGDAKDRAQERIETIVAQAVRMQNEPGKEASR